MKLQSVKQTAERFNISERRVQKLCEEGRIAGAQMISNVWLIPSDAVKPLDERSVNGGDLLSLSDLCSELSVSVATGRNWLRLGKISPCCETKRSPLFSQTYVNSLKEEIKNGKNGVLKSRRNKKHITGNNIYNSYVSELSESRYIVKKIIDEVDEACLELTDSLLRLVISECAIQLFLRKIGYTADSNTLSKYIQGNLPENDCWYLIDDLINNQTGILDIISKHPELFNHRFEYEPSEDTLGLLYISLKNIGERKATGSYYTPTRIVKKLCNKLFSMNNPVGKKILDPCCGTGNFILQLPNEIDFEYVYGNDIDTISVQIARINFALKYDQYAPEIVYGHITEKDYLCDEKENEYDFIIGNPPWGYDFSDLYKRELRSRYYSALGNSIESYDIFVEQALSNLNPDGILSFILPEAILNVKTHTMIRSKILSSCDFQYIEYIGNAFDKVQCPCIILQMLNKKAGFSSIGMIVSDGSREFKIMTEREITANCISLSMTDEEYRIVKKMGGLNNKTTLKGQAKYALGIVTGNNNEYIKKENTHESETVLKGSDLLKFRIKPSENYMVFSPERFQQVAPTKMYRAPEKLLYRFICNQLVFAYDDKQTLSLNSCNILIPEIPDIKIKYIMAVLNSRCMQFYFKKQFNSVKVLRAHLEELPIPMVSAGDQNKIIALVDDILDSNKANEIKKFYDELDKIIATFYNIKTEEYGIIKSTMDEGNLFLT